MPTIVSLFFSKLFTGVLIKSSSFSREKEGCGNSIRARLLFPLLFPSSIVGFPISHGRKKYQNGCTPNSRTCFFESEMDRIFSMSEEKTAR